MSPPSQAEGPAQDESGPARPVLHVEVAGHGPTIVLAHGFAGSARNLRPQVRALSARYRVVTYDARGHARSPAAIAGGASLPDLVGDLASLVERFEPAGGGAIVGGVSLGAAVSLELLRARPELVRGLLLLAPPSPSPRHLEWARALAEAIDAEGLDAAGERLVWGGGRFDPAAAAAIRAGFLEHSAGSLAALARGALAELPELELWGAAVAGARVPVAVVVGELDRAALRTASALGAASSAARVSVIPGAGHVFNLTHAALANAALRDFLAEHFARDAAD